MKRIFSTLFLLLFFLSLALPAAVLAGKGDSFPTAPVKNNGKKWRCAYYEGGLYPDYQIIFIQTINGLIELGWVQPLEFPQYNPDHGAFWKWFCKNVKSDYLEFVPDAFYSADFKAVIRKEMKSKCLQRLKVQKDIDFVFAMGTWAGQDLANTQHSVPLMVASASNPIASKVIASAEDSGLDHVHAKVDPERYERQVRLFHDMVGFKTLGVVHDDTAEGRTFAGIGALEKVARESGFKVERCLAPTFNHSKRQYRKMVADCYVKIAPKVDAVYITVHDGVTLANLPNIMKPINAHQLPSFSMKGSEEVQHGVLMSISQANFKYVGQFHAEVLGKILNGAKPRDISQVWKAPPKIALNLKTAQEIGYDPPVDILMASDEIYEDIKVSDKKR